MVAVGAESVTADYLTLNKDRGDIFAKGNVVYSGGDKVWKGQELTYNYKTKVGRPGPFSMFLPPYFITAEDSQKVSTNVTVLRRVKISTCDEASQEFVVKMEEA